MTVIRVICPTSALAADLGVAAVELHTGEYANAAGPEERDTQLARLRAATDTAIGLGLAVHAGHGLTYENVTPVAAIAPIEEPTAVSSLCETGFQPVALLALTAAAQDRWPY